MKNQHILSAASLSLLLAACSSLGGPPPPLGTTVAAVEAKYGKPTDSYRRGDETELEYATGPAGQATYMARFGPDGALRSYEQVLDTPGFARVKLNQSTKADVRYALGRPAQVTALHNPELEVWSYRFKESGYWDSVMYVHFDPQGVVRVLYGGPDPQYNLGGGRR